VADETGIGEVRAAPLSREGSAVLVGPNGLRPLRHGARSDAEAVGLAGKNPLIFGRAGRESCQVDRFRPH
jgi:hypothetical protein